MLKINLLKPGVIVYDDSEPGGIIDIKPELKPAHKADLAEILWDKKDFDEKMKKELQVGE